MEARKVQRVGQTTLAVSLPKRWTEEINLKRGDTVFLQREKDQSLRLVPSTLARREAAPRISIINADLCTEPRMLERIVVGNYAMGRDTMWVVSSDRLRSSHVEEVRDITSKLMGLGIMEESSKRMVLQCSIDSSKFPIHTLIRRLYIIASTIHKEAIQALLDRNYEFAEDAIRRENEADRLYWLIVRLLLSSLKDRSIAEKIGVEDPRQITGSRSIAALLERIADWGEIIAKDVIEIGNRMDHIDDFVIGALSSISEAAYDVCSKAMECLYTGDIKLANIAIMTYEETVEVEEEELVKKMVGNISNKEACPYLRRVALGIRRIAELGAEISEIAINRVLEKSSKFCEIRSRRGDKLPSDRLNSWPGAIASS